MLMSKIEITSQIANYEVEFITSYKHMLENVMLEGDVILIDSKVKQIYKDSFDLILNDSNCIEIDSSESVKSYQGIIPIIQDLIGRNFKRNNKLIAVGGGITQDVVAFTASVLYRGVTWYFFPTTLLAQGDSCIGSKTSINFVNYKNLIGGFYPPKKIYLDPVFLKSLSDIEIRSGLGEMLHYFVVSGKDDFIFFKNNYERAITNDGAMLALISRSLQIKKKYVELDEFDTGIRQIFNYGHSFGHALESIFKYQLPHGIAVSFGIDIANYISMRAGFLSESVLKDVRLVVNDLHSDFSIKDLDIDQFLLALQKDKKNEGSKLGLILLSGFGEAFKHLIEPDVKFQVWLKEYFKSL